MDEAANFIETTFNVSLSGETSIVKFFVIGLVGLVIAIILFRIFVEIAPYLIGCLAIIVVSSIIIGGIIICKALSISLFSLLCFFVGEIIGIALIVGIIKLTIDTIKSLF